MLLLPLSVWNITEMYKTERSNVLFYFFCMYGMHVSSSITSHFIYCGWVQSY